jgi:hypothetical protein
MQAQFINSLQHRHPSPEYHQVFALPPVDWSANLPTMPTRDPPSLVAILENSQNAITPEYYYKLLS